MRDMELDALVAEKIMNCPPWPRANDGTPCYHGMSVDAGIWLGWSPTSKIEHAWEVVESFRVRGYYVSIQNCHAPKKDWCVIICDNNPVGNPKEGIGEGQGEIGPAICLAALDVLNIKLPKNSIYAKTRRKPRKAPRKNKPDS